MPRTYPILALLTATTVLTGLGGVSAQTATVSDILSRLDAAQKGARDISFRVSGTANLQGGAQKVDLSVQTIPASGLARLVFAAPDALADNIVVVDRKEVRNYLYLTNQVTVTSLSRSAAGAGMTGLDLTQIGNFSTFLKTYDVKLVSTSGAAGSRLYGLEGVPRQAGVNENKARIYISEAGWRPTRVQLLGAADKVTADLNISSYKLNAGLTSARLRTLPKDAEVIRQ